MATTYPDLKYLMAMDFDECLELFREATEIKQERRQWELYCSAYPHYTEKNFMTFEQFYQKSNPKMSTRPTEDIIDEVATMRKKYGW